MQMNGDYDTLLNCCSQNQILIAYDCNSLNLSQFIIYLTLIYIKIQMGIRVNLFYNTNVYSTTDLLTL